MLCLTDCVFVALGRVCGLWFLVVRDSVLDFLEMYALRMNPQQIEQFWLPMFVCLVVRPSSSLVLERHHTHPTVLHPTPFDLYIYCICHSSSPQFCCGFYAIVRPGLDGSSCTRRIRGVHIHSTYITNVTKKVIIINTSRKTWKPNQCPAHTGNRNKAQPTNTEVDASFLLIC